MELTKGGANVLQVKLLKIILC